MNYRILRKIGKNDYFPINDITSDVDILWLLLNGTPTLDLFLKDWIVDPLQGVLSTNNCLLWKGGDKVTISFLYAEVDPEDDPNALLITKQQLCDLVDRWDKLCEADVEKIIICGIGGDFTVSEYLEQERSL